MKVKLLIFGLVVFGLLVALLLTNKDEQSPVQPPQGQNMQGRTPGGLNYEGTELPTVKKVSISVKDSQDKIYGPYEIGDNKVEIPELGVSLGVTDFYTHWNWKMKALNISFHEVNPAVKVDIYVDGKTTGHGWAFKNMPFFSMSGHQPEEAGAKDNLRFSLNSYDGLELPKGHSAMEVTG